MKTLLLMFAIGVVMFACIKQEKPQTLCYMDGNGRGGFVECCTSRGDDPWYSNTAICEDGTTRTITNRWIEEMVNRAMSID